MGVQLGALAKILMQAKSAGSVEDAYYVLAGLTSLSTTGKLPKPVALALASPTVPLAEVCEHPSSVVAAYSPAMAALDDLLIEHLAHMSRVRWHCWCGTMLGTLLSPLASRVPSGEAGVAWLET